MTRLFIFITAVLFNQVEAASAYAKNDEDGDIFPRRQISINVATMSSSACLTSSL
jgi:hypothetical protein